MLSPLIGIILFVVAYLLAALLYPGGSQADLHSKGFSWLHNYWCNLLNEKAMNGELNGGRPFAMAGMFILCISMALFWHLFATGMNFKNYRKIFIQVSGILSMGTGFFLFTSHHDIIINITGGLALVAFAGTFTGLYKSGWRKLFWLGVFIVFLIGLNNFIYYNKGLIAFLPVVQKITFLLFLVWIVLINIGLSRLAKQNS